VVFDKKSTGNMVGDLTVSRAPVKVREEGKGVGSGLGKADNCFVVFWVLAEHRGNLGRRPPGRY
jgi:hypothetical protein